ITKLDGTARTDFATVEAPQQIAVNPFQPGPDVAFTVTVAAKGSVQIYDKDGKRVYINSEVEDAWGVSAVPATQAGAGVLEVPTTRARTSGTIHRPDGDFASGPTTSTYALIVSLVILGGLAIFA